MNKKNVRMAILLFVATAVCGLAYLIASDGGGRVADVSSSKLVGGNDNNIAKAMAITALSPNEGENIEVGEYLNISWRTVNPPFDSTLLVATIYVYEGAPGSRRRVGKVAGNQPITGSYAWNWVLSDGNVLSPGQYELQIIVAPACPEYGTCGDPSPHYSAAVMSGPFNVIQ